MFELFCCIIKAIKGACNDVSAVHLFLYSGVLRCNFFKHHGESQVGNTTCP